MQHIIKKQIIDLSLDRGLDAFHIQQKVSDSYYSKIVPLLQKVFDENSTDEEIISIDNLIIDLGVITEKVIVKENWEEIIFKNLTEQLIPLKSDISAGIKVKKKTYSLSVSEQWIFYMQHGYLPWNLLQINQDWYDKVLEAFASHAGAISNLRNLINRHPDSTRRIVFQNSIPFLKSLIETLTAEDQEVLPQLIIGLAEIISSSDKNNSRGFSLEQRKMKLWERSLKLAASENTKLKSGEIVCLLLANDLSSHLLNSKKVKEFLSENKIGPSSNKQIIKDDHIKPGNLKKELSTKEIIEKENKLELTEEGIYVFNAGVVLLHPFLNLFF